MGYSREIYDAVPGGAWSGGGSARAEAAAPAGTGYRPPSRAREIEQQMALPQWRYPGPFWAAGTWRPPWRRSRPAICPCRPARPDCAGGENTGFRTPGTLARAAEIPVWFTAGAAPVWRPLLRRRPAAA